MKSTTCKSKEGLICVQMGKKERPYFNTAKEVETAVLVTVEQPKQKDSAEELLDELEQLAETAGAKTMQRFVQKLAHPNPRTYVGTGKLEEVAAYVAANKVDIAIFDDELTPSQIRNLEQSMKDVKILDRSNLILDIFANNAKSAEAKLQVELAQSVYLLPRLTRMWTHLSKQKGGIGMKGPGETEIETDRRALRNKISVLRERLDALENQARTRRLNREERYRVALIGYTNVGKSTLMNALAKAEVLAENKLFATLDTTVRKWIPEVPEDGSTPMQILLSDTVGFIRKLPTQLIESFKSTLAETLEADLLMHVVDISHPKFEEQMQAVKETLKEIGAGAKPVLVVFNKIDAYKGHEEDFYIGSTGMTLEEFERSWIGKENAPAVFISAGGKVNLEKLRKKTVEILREIR